MLCLFLAVASASPIYNHELRSIPEKLRQGRIQDRVQNTFKLVQSQIMRSATMNLTETNFTLFCLEPNKIYKEIKRDSRRGNVFRKRGAIYKLTDDPEYGEFIPLMRRPLCSVKMGYELYSRYYQYPYYSPDHPYYVPLVNSNTIPGISHKTLEDRPAVYIDLFFNLFDHVFPELNLTISKERTSHADDLFETDCCPIYIVSW